MFVSTAVMLGLGRFNVTRITRGFIVTADPHVKVFAASIMLHNIGNTHHNIYHSQDQEIAAINKKLKCE